MNCYFCKKECILGHEEKDFVTWVCPAHTNKVVHHILISKQGPVHQITTIGWKHYVVFMYHDANTVKFSIYDPVKLQDVLELKYLPQITPEEFDSKLPNWILFS